MFFGSIPAVITPFKDQEVDYISIEKIIQLPDDNKKNIPIPIIIFTHLVKKNKLYIQAGGGIVFDSDPEKEYQETINKANALILAAKDSYKYK